MADQGSPPSAHILVVDDEPSIVDALSTVLRYEGYDVAFAESGQGALELARRGALDLIILDVMLPDVDGFEVTRRLRSEGIDVPVPFLTAKTGVDERVTGLSIGGDDYVTKPPQVRCEVARSSPQSKKWRAGRRSSLCKTPRPRSSVTPGTHLTPI